MTTAKGTAHRSESEKRDRMQQLEEIVRRLNPQLTDEEFEELMLHFRRQFGLT